MKAKIVVLAFLLAQSVGCDRSSNDFVMTVDKVDELKGLVLKGISITGRIEKGCIANDDEYVVKREGQEVLRTTTRVVNVEGLKNADSFTGEVEEGEVVTFYIPDGKKEDVLPGDVVSSSTTSCGKKPAE